MLIQWFLSIGLFTGMLWAPRVFTFWSRAELEQTFVIPQLKFLLDAFPMLVQKWPGPLTGSHLTNEHLQFVALFYGGIGWLVGHWIYRLNDLWFSRMVWLLFSWLIWMGGLNLLGGILTLGK